MADEKRDSTYDPTSVQVDRARMQGLGVGARDDAYDARDGDEVGFTQPSGGAGA